MLFSRKKSTSTYPPFSHKAFQEPPERAPLIQQRSTALPIYGAIVVPFVLGIVVTLAVTKPDQQSDITESTETPLLENLDDPVPGGQQQVEVTRGQSADLISPVQPTAEVLPEVSAPVRTDEPSQAAPATIAIAQAVEQVTNTPPSPELNIQMLKEAALAGDYLVEIGQLNDKWLFMLHPLKLDINRKELESLLLSAEGRGELSMPDGARLASGKVDLDAALFNLVQSALISEGTEESTKAAQEMSQRAFLAIAESQVAASE